MVSGASSFSVQGKPALADCRSSLITGILLVFCLLPFSILGSTPRALQVATGEAGFTKMESASTGVRFMNSLALDRHLTNQVLLNGSGVAAGDIDGDGLTDLYFCGLDDDNGLYRNLGDWRFEDITAGAGVACSGLDSTGAAFADLDGDGDLDLIVNSIGKGTHLFKNEGGKKFSAWKILNSNRAGMTIGIADYDGDGFLDFYITNYRISALMDMPNTHFGMKMEGGKRVISTVNGRPASDPEFLDRFSIDEAGGVEEFGEPDALFRNLGGTNFVPIAFPEAFVDESGKPLAKAPMDWGLSVLFRDFTGDGKPDLYVCNDFQTPDRIWINQGNGKFAPPPAAAFRHTSHFSMGADVADINRDGFDDIFVVDMMSRSHAQRANTLGLNSTKPGQPGEFAQRRAYMFNTLQLARGDGTYSEIAHLAGVAASEWSWSTLFIDADLDGYEDIFVTNGTERDGRNIDVGQELRRLRQEKNLSPTAILQSRTLFPRQVTPNVIWRNKGDLTFEDKTSPWGLHEPVISHGVCLADLDNDGDADLVVNNLNAGPGVYKNNSAAPRISVSLKASSPNRYGIGARITLKGDKLSQSQVMTAGSRYLSSDQPFRSFAALSGSQEIEVIWPTGLRTLLTQAKPNHHYEISEAESTKREIKSKPSVQPLFSDVSHTINHSHVENLHDDFAAAPLIPSRRTQQGPALSWCDLDGDGWEDLIIGGSQGQTLGLFRNQMGGAFTRWPQDSRGLPADVTGLLGIGRQGRTSLLALLNNQELVPERQSLVFYLQMENTVATKPTILSNTAVASVSAADIDQDGDLDVFLGGQSSYRQFGKPSPSWILRQESDGELKAEPFAAPALVNGTAFADIDADGDADLLLACEWNSLKLFRNDQGRFTDVSQEAGLLQFKGLWQGITVADFNNDGLIDIAASNWGRNHHWPVLPEKSLRLYYNIDSATGSYSIEAVFDPESQAYVPARPMTQVIKNFPDLVEKYSTYESLGRSPLHDLIPSTKTGPYLEANYFDSAIFLQQQNGTFSPKPLPIESQFSAASGIVAADFNNDGNNDIFLAQNFFAVPPEVPRQDAGRGLLLLGNVNGEYVPATGSGISLYGEQRAAAAADFDHDGRLDLAISQNAGETKLFRNVSASAGIRVRLHGQPRNHLAIGARITVRTASGKTITREITAGAGYLSQNSLTQVFPPDSQKISVKWPGGAVTQETQLVGRDVQLKHP